MTIKPILVFALVGLTGPAFAQDSSTLNIDGANMVTEIAAPSHMENVDTIYSGWRFRSTETQELELDDFDNPAFVFIDQGIDFWNKVEGSAGKACASCHTNVEDFAGLRATLPRVEGGKLVSMENLINDCRTERMGAVSVRRLARRRELAPLCIEPVVRVATLGAYQHALLRRGRWSTNGDWC